MLEYPPPQAICRLSRPLRRPIDSLRPRLPAWCPLRSPISLDRASHSRWLRRSMTRGPRTLACPPCIASFGSTLRVASRVLWGRGEWRLSLGPLGRRVPGTHHLRGIFCVDTACTVSCARGAAPKVWPARASCAGSACAVYAPCEVCRG